MSSIAYTRHLHDLGDPYAKRPVDLELTYSQHCCPQCKCHFNANMEDLASPKSRYTRRVVDVAVRLVYEDGLSPSGSPPGYLSL